MSPQSNVVDRSAGERVHYFSRELITAEDMIDEQNFFLEKQRRHNRFLHGWGVVCGCTVDAAPTLQSPWRVTISPGYVLDPRGNEIHIVSEASFDLAGSWPSPNPCAPAGSWRPPGKLDASNSARTAFIAVYYDECDTRPVRVHPAGCGCDEASCEYSRVRDSFCIGALSEIPEYQTTAEKADAQWLAAVKTWADGGHNGAAPIAPGPDPVADPCVVLAKITLPAALAPLEKGSVDNTARRVLYSVHSFDGLIRSLK